MGVVLRLARRAGHEGGHHLVVDDRVQAPAFVDEGLVHGRVGRLGVRPCEPGVEGGDGAAKPVQHEQHGRRLEHGEEGVLKRAELTDAPAGGQLPHPEVQTGRERAGDRGRLQVRGEGGADDRQAEGHPQQRRRLGAMAGLPGERPRREAGQHGHRVEPCQGADTTPRPRVEGHQHRRGDECTAEHAEPEPADQLQLLVGRHQRGDQHRQARQGDRAVDQVGEAGGRELFDVGELGRERTRAKGAVEHRSRTSRAHPDTQSTSPSRSCSPPGQTARTMPAAASALRHPGHGGSVM